MLVTDVRLMFRTSNLVHRCRHRKIQPLCFHLLQKYLRDFDSCVVCLLERIRGSHSTPGYPVFEYPLDPHSPKHESCNFT